MNFSNFLQRWKVFPPSHLGDWTNWKRRWLFHIFPEKFKTQLFIQLCLSLVNCILVQQNNQVDCIFHFHVDISDYKVSNIYSSWIKMKATYPWWWCWWQPKLKNEKIEKRNKTWILSHLCDTWRSSSTLSHQTWQFGF